MLPGSVSAVQVLSPRAIFEVRRRSGSGHDPHMDCSGGSSGGGSSSQHRDRHAGRRVDLGNGVRGLPPDEDAAFRERAFARQERRKEKKKLDDAAKAKAMVAGADLKRRIAQGKVKAPVVKESKVARCLQPGEHPPGRYAPAFGPLTYRQMLARRELAATAARREQASAADRAVAASCRRQRRCWRHRPRPWFAQCCRSRVGPTSSK